MKKSRLPYFADKRSSDKRDHILFYITALRSIGLKLIKIVFKCGQNMIDKPYKLG